MNVGEKPNHPALDLYNSSLIWKEQCRDENDVRELMQQIQFPMPGAEYCNIMDMAPHTAIVGTTGSGKTILLKTLHAVTARRPD